MKIIIKENAEKMLKNKLEKGQFLRVMVTEGGCAGLTYTAEVGREMNDNETTIIEQGGIRVVSDDNSSKYLDGLVIDYSDELFNGGLKFTNSNTKSTCGCGSSFALSGFPEIQGGKCTN
ncbi:MAG: iron-sulfur cluster assembly accessory protein [Proteobacteria bacterium]|nr:iron-sulfur cluster assembly accessory protein [Desulfobulbaceae bacterium]MBU4153984.1 iron-sulfur cluster assembly accessory protein [Pseudomonadota bacterium]MDP2106253.1 iron-sulfur cluster assembly accessory protein [Desulfobulbaceae bacterium]